MNVQTKKPFSVLFVYTLIIGSTRSCKHASTSSLSAVVIVVGLRFTQEHWILIMWRFIHVSIVFCINRCLVMFVSPYLLNFGFWGAAQPNRAFHTSESSVKSKDRRRHDDRFRTNFSNFLRVKTLKKVSILFWKVISVKTWQKYNKSLRGGGETPTQRPTYCELGF